MEKVKKSILIILGIFLLINQISISYAITGDLTETTLENKTVTGLISINNNTQNSDYKINESTHNSVKNKLKFNSDVIEDFIDDDEIRNLEELSVEKSYLISNNILARDESFSFVDNELEYSLKYSDNVDSEFHMKKSELYMLLYKAKWGTINSRPVVFNYPSIRNIDSINSTVDTVASYTDTNGDTYNASFIEGDYYYYIAPNVYELYLTKLLDKGIIHKSELLSDDTHTFVTEYENLSRGTSIPEWHTKNSIAYAEQTSNALGSTYQYSADGTVDSLNYDDFPEFFKEEKISVMEALSIIEDFMKISEKTMTDAEASIITYKYGVNYLNNLSSSEKATISFLIAKGVLNFEEENAGLNYYETFSKELGYQLIYRFANTDARFDFSKITLTDKDIEWLDRGYAEDNLTVFRTVTAPTVKTIKDNDTINDISITSDESGDGSNNSDDMDPDTGWNIISKIFNSFKGIEATADTIGYEDYEVTKLFDTNFQYTYEGTSITELKVDDTTIKEIKKDDDYLIITFIVSASDEKAAISCVDNKIQCNISNDYEAKISCFTMITDKSSGNETGSKTLIPASAIKKYFSEISIISDKVLVNTVTGTQALILPDAGYALVGTKIVVSDDLMIIDGNDDVYYNLELIASLFSKIQFTNVSSAINSSMSMFITTSESDEVVYEVKQSDTVLNKTYVSKIKYKNSEGKNKTVRMYNINTMTRGLNTISRDFTIKDSEDNDTKVTLILDFNFVVPDPELFAKANLSNKIINGGLTASDVTDAFYTRPTDDEAELQKWWDSNIGMANALCNFMYGTKKLMYVNTGYLAPSLTILSESKKVTDTEINKLFKSFQMLEINGVSYSNYINGTTSGFWKSYFNEAAGMSGSLKALAQSTRLYKQYLGYKESDYGKLYGTDYFVTNAGTIYRSIKDDTRIKADNTNKVLNLYTRSTHNITSLTVGDEVTYTWQKYTNGSSQDVSSNWLYKETTEDGNYYKLLPMFSALYPYGTSVKSEEYPEEITIQNSVFSLGTDNYSNQQADILEFFTSFYKQWFGDLNIDHPSNYNKPSQMFTVDNKQNWLLDDINYGNIESNTSTKTITGTKTVLVNGTLKYYGRKFDGTVGLYDYTSGADLENHIDVLAIPTMYIPTGGISCYLDSDGNIQIASGYMATALNYGNAYFGNINQNIIDAALFKENECIPLNNLSSNDQVYIGDILFTKTSEGFNSQATGDINLASAMASDNQEKIQAAIAEYFATQIITCGTKQYKLTDYMKEVGVGRGLNISEDIAALGVLCKNGNTVGVQTANGFNADSTSNANSACLLINFNDGLYCRPLDTEGNVYTLVYVTNSLSSSRFDDLPFLGESLNYPERDKVDVKLDLSLFNISQYKNAMKDKFEKFFRKEFLTSLQGLIYMFIVCFASYIAVMSWVVYGILHYNIGRNFLTMIANPGRDKAYKGLDLIKIFTFGIYNLDSDPPPSRCFVVTLLSFIIISILLNSMPA